MKLEILFRGAIWTQYPSDIRYWGKGDYDWVYGNEEITNEIFLEQYPVYTWLLEKCDEKLIEYDYQNRCVEIPYSSELFEYLGLWTAIQIGAKDKYETGLARNRLLARSAINARANVDSKSYVEEIQNSQLLLESQRIELLEDLSVFFDSEEIFTKEALLEEQLTYTANEYENMIKQYGETYWRLKSEFEKRENLLAERDVELETKAADLTREKKFVSEAKEDYLKLYESFVKAKEESDLKTSEYETLIDKIKGEVNLVMKDSENRVALQLSESNARLVEAERRFQLLQSEYNEIDSRVKKDDALIENLSIQIEAASNAVVGYERELMYKNEEYKRLQSLAVQMEGKLGYLLGELDAKNKEIEEKTMMLQTSNDRLMLADVRLKQMEKLLKDSETYTEAKLKTIQSLVEDRDSTISKLSSKLTDSESYLDYLLNENANEDKGLPGKKRKRSEELNAAIKHHDTLKAESSVVLESLERLETELSGIKDMEPPLKFEKLALFGASMEQLLPGQVYPKSIDETNVYPVIKRMERNLEISIRRLARHL